MSPRCHPVLDSWLIHHQIRDSTTWTIILTSIKGIQICKFHFFFFCFTTKLFYYNNEWHNLYPVSIKIKQWKLSNIQYLSSLDSWKNPKYHLVLSRDISKKRMHFVKKYVHLGKTHLWCDSLDFQWWVTYLICWKYFYLFQTTLSCEIIWCFIIWVLTQQ